MSFPPDTIFARSADLLSTVVDGELVMLDVDSGQYFNLNSTGTVIWEQLAVPTRFDALLQQMHAQYDAPLETLRADIAALLCQMLDHRLVRIHTS